MTEEIKRLIKGALESNSRSQKSLVLLFASIFLAHLALRVSLEKSWSAFFCSF